MKHASQNLGGKKAAAGAVGVHSAPRLRLLPALLLTVFATAAVAQDGTFQLGTVVVSASAHASESVAEQVMGKDAIQQNNADTVSAAVAISREMRSLVISDSKLIKAINFIAH